MRVLLFVFSLVIGLASAERYGVQVAAFQDDAQALALVAALERQGFAAYREGTSREESRTADRQYSRVRVGCFTDAAGAEDLAALLRRGVAAEAVVVALEHAAPVPCLERELGFRAPEGWGLAASTAGAAVFWVQLGARRGFVLFDGAGWQVVQAEAVDRAEGGILVTQPGGAQEELPLPSAGGSASFEGFSERPGAPERVVARGPGGELTLSSGRLLWWSPQAAVVQNGELIVSIRVQEPR